MTKKTQTVQYPSRNLGALGAITIIVGIVVGAGIFKTPSLVASVTGDWGWALSTWVLGGVISLIGALCYAELATTYPHAGGDYHFLSRAYGRHVSFLYAWAKATVINTGSIALLAFVFGDYFSSLLNLGTHSSAIWAMLIVLLLTGTNLAGLKMAASLQSLLTGVVFFGLLIVALGAMWIDAPATELPAPFSSTPPLGMLGLAMVFVLLTFGGWNESAYISAEVKGGPRAILPVIVISLFLITVLYLAFNVALLSGLGLQGLANSPAAASELVGMSFGSWADRLVSTLVALAALTSINATMIVGARSNYALGHDWHGLRFLGSWKGNNTPVMGHIIQSGIALALIGVGSTYVDGFEAMVEFTAPVFWGFLLLVGLALMQLRRKDPHAERPFSVPLYPILPLVFCVVCGYLTYSSVVYAHSQGAVHISLVVMSIGVVALLLISRGGPPKQATAKQS